MRGRPSPPCSPATARPACPASRTRRTPRAATEAGGMDRLIEYYANAEILAQYGPGIIDGLWVTLGTALATVVLGIAGGLAMAVALAARVPVLRQLITLWVELFRTLPQLAVIIVLYFGLPYAGITLSPFWATVGGLAAVLSAFAAEIFR